MIVPLALAWPPLSFEPEEERPELPPAPEETAAPDEPEEPDEPAGP